MSMGMSGGPPVAAKEVPSWKLMAMMTGAGAIAGLLIVTAFELTLPRIEKHQGEVMKAAIEEVLRAPASYDTLHLVDGKLVRELPAGLSPKGIERIYRGYDAEGHPIGFAVRAGETGFQELVTVMFGYDDAERKLIAMRVIANKETPGLGDKIVKDTGFVNAFDTIPTPLRGVTKDRGKSGPGDIVMITGATISSRAVIRIINNAIERWQPLMDAYRRETGATP